MLNFITQRSCHAADGVSGSFSSVSNPKTAKAWRSSRLVGPAFSGLIAGLMLFVVPSFVMAFPSFLDQFNAKYGTAGKRLDSCGTCHNDFSSGKRNPYGKDFKNNSFNLSAIESMDSDGDGASNIDEITGLYMPGYTCQTAGGTTNGPPNLLDFVEPNGCGAMNSPPTANAGADQTVTVGTTVQLNGGGSSDPDGDPLTYQWSILSIPAGSTATISDPTIVNPTISIDLPGFYSLQLIVNDGTVDSQPDFVNISTTNSAPVANAGPDRQVNVGAMVTLDGSGSSDADGDTLSFQWTVVSVPAGSTAVLSDSTVPMPTFTADLAGNYMMQLVVNDGTVDSAPDTVTITAAEVMNNTPPVADAGPDQTVLVTQTALLDGRGSSDADGDPLTYQWSFVTMPTGSAATLSDPTSPTPDFVVDKPGMYVVQLIVNDGLADSSPDTVMVDTTNSPPVANAGPDQTVIPGSTVQLDGSQSMDADGDTLTYQWSLTSVPAGSAAMLSDATVANPAFVADMAGVYVAQLIVNDGMVDSAPDMVTIQARDMNQQGELKIEEAKVSPDVNDKEDHHDGKEEKDDHDGDKEQKKDKKPKEFKLKVKGKGAPAGSKVRVSDAITGTMLGMANANEDGKWKLKVKIQEASSVPCRVRAEYDDQIDEKDVKHAPPGCSGGVVPPMPDMDDDDHDDDHGDDDKDDDHEKEDDD